MAISLPLGSCWGPSVVCVCGCWSVCVSECQRICFAPERTELTPLRPICRSCPHCLSVYNVIPTLPTLFLDFLGHPRVKPTARGGSRARARETSSISPSVAHPSPGPQAWHLCVLHAVAGRPQDIGHPLGSVESGLVLRQNLGPALAPRTAHPSQLRKGRPWPRTRASRSEPLRTCGCPFSPTASPCRVSLVMAGSSSLSLRWGPPQ